MSERSAHLENTGKKKCRWRRRKEARPSEIVDAALVLFVERGFKATKLEDIAHHAGISKGTVYLYFENKEALFRAVVQEIVLPELVWAEQQVEAHSGSREALIRALILGWWRRVGGTRIGGIPKLIVAEAGNFPELAKFFVHEVVHRARRILVYVLEAGIADGEFRDCNVHHTVRALMAPMVYAAIWKQSLYIYDNEPYDVAEVLRVHLDHFFYGLRVERGRK